MNQFDKVLSLITFAGIAGLVILNYKGANTIFGTLSSSANTYVKTVQGR